MASIPINIKYPKSILLKNDLKEIKDKEIKLIVKGQGIFLFENTINDKECIFTLYDKNKVNGIQVKFTKYEVRVIEIVGSKPLIDGDNKSGLLNKNGVYYWFSIDAQNQQLFAGYGEARAENIIYHYYYDKNKTNKSFLESIVSIDISKDHNNINMLKLLRDPITSSISLSVKDTNNISMLDIASGSYLPSSNLSSTAQKLYNCISGTKFVLDDDDFPNFSEAIKYNIITPGCWCYEKLLSKSTEFNPDKPNILETYLRITLGQNNGESPGVPYVMEIWPSNHFSPIHNHAGANAIIRVLHGSINVSLYPFLCPEGIQPFGTYSFDKDDITWISPTLNQTHQLYNSDDTTPCITIQCYMYEGDNDIHYDYFDYIDADGIKQYYEPDSDLDFIQFKEIIREEWERSDNNLKKCSTNLLFCNSFYKFFN
jgi:hypothetical protein